MKIATEAQLTEWHRNIAGCAGLLSGTLSRRRQSPTLVLTLEERLGPILAEIKAMRRERVALTLTKEARRAART
jgi:hypothetical protein